MDEQQRASDRNRGRFRWLLVILAILLLWWFVRPPADDDDSHAIRGDHAAADGWAHADAAQDLDPDDILLDLRDDVDAETIAAIEAQYGLTLTLVSDESYDERFYRAHVAPHRRDAVLSELAHHPVVEIAEPDALFYLPAMTAAGDTASGPSAHWGISEQVTLGDSDLASDPQNPGFPNDPMYKYQWHMRQIGMPEAWKLADGDGVTVAVIDTGVAYENRDRFHLVPDLDGVEFVHPYNFVSNNNQADDDHGHGTHVAGTIAQMTNNGIGVTGIALKVKIMPLKVLSGSGSGSVGGIADAIRFAADNGAQVINMSLGGRFPSRVLKKAVQYAHDQGVTVVCAAGNDGRGSVSYPAAYPGAVAVSATQYDESITFYSNYGDPIDIAAPGGNTRVDQNDDGMPDGVLQNTIEIGNPTANGYFPFMGTSMASPHAAGVAALIVGEGITDPTAVEDILESSARAPEGQQFDKRKYGAGIIDAPSAVLKARGETGGWQLLLGLLMASALAGSLRRRNLLTRTLGPSYLTGVLFGASGLFFVPYLIHSATGLIGMTGLTDSTTALGAILVPILDILTRGIPSWDVTLLGPAGHGNALFFSALIPLGLALALYGFRRLRPLVAGMAVGVAAHLAFHAAVRLTDILYVPNVLMLDELWLAANAAISLALAALILRR